jgi:methylmalonyl-CoA mutase, N-terminal domain
MKKGRTTLSGLPLQPHYTLAHRKGKKPPRPGVYPFTRSLRPTQYRKKLWTMRQFSGFATAKHTNERFHYLLRHGQSGLSIAFDLPTLMGHDSDHALSKGEVGKDGVAVSSLADLEIVLKGIPLDKVTISMTINSSAAILLCMVVALAQKRGVPLKKLSGTVQNDIFKEYVAQNTFIYPPKPSLRLIVDSIAYCTRHLPRWNPISISGYHIREAGATAVEELAFTLANGIGYVQACVDRGMPVDDFAQRLSFFFDIHNDFFEEIAKLRAARKIWAKWMRHHFKAKDPRSWWCRFHCQSAGVSLTAQQPMNNLSRTALQAMAAVLGGTLSLHTNSMDEALALPSEEAAQLALFTQHILANETNVASTIDPLGGSYLLEDLTSRIEQDAEKIIRKVQAMGGAEAAIENGYYQGAITQSALAFQRQVDSKERLVVGVNAYTDKEPITIPILRVDPGIERSCVQALKKLRDRRDNQLVAKRLEILRKRAQGTQNLMPTILEAVKSYATLGEICNVFRDVFGEHTK